MCGIAGVLRWDGWPVARAELEAMVAALAHRGPEGSGAEIVGSPPVSVGLGHTRLRIIDLSDAANQPMVNDGGTVWLVFNGEIYNYPALRNRLTAQGVRFRTTSDTEVLLRLYEAEGERCVHHLDGMFAFAIWDATRQCLLLGRDRVGKKPLCYSARPGQFVFASEVKALLRCSGVPCEVDESSLPALFLYGYVPAPHTVYRDVRKLPPGHLLRIDATGRTTMRPYWDVPLVQGTPKRMSQADAAARLRELVTEAVQRRLIADVPLGAFLSGGLDSSLIVGVMTRLLRRPVRTFSIGFADDPAFDETRYARQVSAAYQTRHTEFLVQPSAATLIEQLVYHHDGPFADSSSIPTYLLCQLTKEHVTVALTGDGGDELFAGYLRFVATLGAERVPAWMRRAAAGALGGLPEWGHHRSRFRQLQKFAAGAALPFADRLTRWISVFYEDLGRLLPGGGALDEHGRPLALAALAPHLAACRGATPLDQLLYINLKTYLPDDLLVKMDRCSMAHALEARSPFLDRALLEFAFSLPDHLKLRGWRTKAIIRHAFADLLPPAILSRGKQGFGVPLRRWFAGELRAFVHDLLFAPDARLRGMVDQAYVRRLCEEHQSGRADHAQRLWMLLTVEVWLRNLHLDPPAAAPTGPAGHVIARDVDLVAP
jgi:asparagine synthase (glutamine-hydrolysing)